MKHSEELYEILEDGKYILYGEWLYAKHSIHYTKLPDCFIAFDLYNIKEKKFISRNKLEEKLKNSTLHIIRLITTSTIKNINDIKKYLVKSNYYDGIVEGVYVRINDDNYTINRGKVVRTDFLSGDEHWSKAQITKNIITNNYITNYR